MPERATVTSEPLGRGGAFRTARALILPVTSRIGSFFARLAGAVLVVQLLIALAPGDAVDLLPNPDQLRPVLEAEWGLDRPLGERLWLTLGRLAQGELGTSLTWRPGAPVSELVLDGVGASSVVVVPALVVGLGSALGTAWWSATPGRRALGPALRTVSVIPAFLAAYLLVTLLNAGAWALMERGLISRPGWFALPDTESLLRGGLAVALLAWVSGGLSEQHTVLEAAIREIRAQPFIEATRARGAAVWPHLLLNLVPTLLELVASRSAAVIGGLLVVERMFLIQGAGSMLWSACLQRDYPLAIGLTLAAATVVSAARLVAELLRLVVDPRLRSVV